MIIDAKTVIFTLLVISAGCIFGLKFIRAFALQIARENHDAIRAMEAEDEEQRLKRERAADAAANSAFAKVKPILTQAPSSTDSVGSLTRSGPGTPV